MKNSDMPAMPLVVPDTVTTQPREGLTKREIMAMHMMAAQISAVSTVEAAEFLTSALDERGIDGAYPERLFAINAVNYADALLSELESHVLP